MSEALRENSIQFFSDVNYLYSRIKENIKQLKEQEELMHELKNAIRKKRQLFCKKNLPFSYLLCILFFILAFSPLYLKSFLFMFLAVVLGFLFCSLFVSLYKKRILVKWEKNYKQVIIPVYEKIIEILEDLTICNSEYEELSVFLPTDCKNDIAVYLMNESLLNDYTASIDDAVDFYQKRYDILKTKKDKISTELYKEIENSKENQKKEEEKLSEVEQKLISFKEQKNE